VVLILVTGAAAGLGLNTATELAEQGHDVVVHARNATRIPTGNLWRGTISGDLADLEQTRDVAFAANEFGTFDVVIHNAGVLHRPDAVLVNAFAPYVLTVEMVKPARLIYQSSSMHRGGSRQEWAGQAPQMT
jgi:NADP-dependent 3-hydroxy acid dehydrogenase YdfG